MMNLTLSDLNNSYLELDIGGRVEEMRKDINLYQKRWVLHFRYSVTFYDFTACLLVSNDKTLLLK